MEPLSRNAVDLVVWARIIRCDPADFMVLVTTMSASRQQSNAPGMSRTGHALDLAGANKLREELIPMVQTTLRARGHRVSSVERVGP
jgi:hypothetical protein